MNGPEIDRLIGLLAALPGFGPRSARRTVLRLLRDPPARMLPLARALDAAAQAARLCSVCGNIDSSDPCTVCSDPERDRGLICVVEEVDDLWALERAKVHRGTYHVLGGVLAPLDGRYEEDLSVEPLLARARHPAMTEVILALGGTVDAASTAHWLADRLRAAAPDLAVTRVGLGVPMGGALDRLDDGTLGAALRGRRGV